MQIWIVWAPPFGIDDTGEFEAAFDTEEKAQKHCQELTDKLHETKGRTCTPKELACYSRLPEYRVSKHEVL